LPDIDAQESQIQSMVMPNMTRDTRILILLAAAIGLGIYYFMVPNVPLWMLLLGGFLVAGAVTPHRSLTHTVWMVIFLGWMVNLINPAWTSAFVVGYVSHLLADLLTVSGIQLLWPVPLNISISAIGIRITTGGVVDQGLFFAAMGLFFLGAFYLFV
jgi:inner membrane protein